MTEAKCPRDSCTSLTSCMECTGSSLQCLWCPSLQHCVPNTAYPYTYIHGQCLGWVSSQSSSCPDNCTGFQTCSTCQSDPRCGWCNDPSDTGLGECSEGGFNSPRNTGACTSSSNEGTYERWFFDSCPGIYVCTCVKL